MLSQILMGYILMINVVAALDLDKHPALGKVLTKLQCPKVRLA